MRSWLFSFALAGALVSSVSPGQAAAQTYGADLAGHPVAILSPGDTHLVVLFFLASDCPVSNRYVPEMRRIEQEFRSRGVAFWYVYPNVTETVATIRAHQAAFTHASEPLIDPQRQLVSLAGVQVTPEAAVLQITGVTLHAVYVGRIDNRYLHIGQERPRATTHDLEQAITDALAGRVVHAPGGPPVGCGIVSTR